MNKWIKQKEIHLWQTCFFIDRIKHRGGKQGDRTKHQTTWHSFFMIIRNLTQATAWTGGPSDLLLNPPSPPRPPLPRPPLPRPPLPRPVSNKFKTHSHSRFNNKVTKMVFSLLLPRP